MPPLRERAFFLQPEWLLVGTFLTLIVIGTILLRLPAATTAEPLSWLDALFTATSAACVTGLIVCDTATDLSRFGQTVVLVLIQLGGLGLMTFAAVGLQLLRVRLSLSSRAALQDTYFQGQLRGNMRGALRRILILTIVFESVGAVLLYFGLRGSPNADTLGGWYEAVFLSVSAFCNAGFSVYSDSLITVGQRTLVVTTIGALIIAGGLGYVVWLEIIRRAWRYLRRQRPEPLMWSLHTRLVLTMTIILLVGGTLALYFTGLSPETDHHGTALADALFQSITTRTAGFNTVSFAALPVPALMLMIPLMFIGGAPGSCAGGVKLTSAAIWLARVRARLQGYDDVVIMGREIPHDIVRRAALILALGVLWNALGILLLAVTEPVGDSLRFLDVVFEQVSAFGTVGLSTGITSELSELGRAWICLSMFAGRLGPLTIALVVVKARRRRTIHFPREGTLVG